MPILLVLILLAVLGLFWPIVVAAVMLFPVGVALLWEVVKEHPIASVVCGILLIIYVAIEAIAEAVDDEKKL